MFAAGVHIPMNTKTFVVFCTVFMLYLLSHNGAEAQKKSAQPTGKQSKTKKAPPSLSTTGAKPQKTKPRVEAGQQELADAVLGASLSVLWKAHDDHFDEGEYNHAVNLCRIIVQGDPKNVEAFANSAYLLWSMERGEEALTFLKQGEDANPDNFYMHDELGQFYWIKLKDPKTAIPYFEKAIKYPAQMVTWNSLGNCYEKTAQWEKALKAWEKASEFADNNVALVHVKRMREKIAALKGGEKK